MVCLEMLIIVHYLYEGIGNEEKQYIRKEKLPYYPTLPIINFVLYSTIT